MGKITLEYIACITGYSKSSVSRVLSGKADKYRISKEAQAKILSVARQEKFIPRASAQLLHNKYVRSIGLVVPHISNPFFAELASATIVEAQAYDLSVLIIDTQEDVRSEEREVRSLIDKGVDGLIIVPCGSDSSYLEELQSQVPIVLVDRYFPNTSLSFISTNNYNGAYQAMMQLLEAGHRSIFCIQGKENAITSKERIKGCKQAVADFGEPCNLYIKGNDYSIENGYVETRIGMTYKPRPTAIFAMSSTILLGSIQALREMQLIVPDEVSIIAFDNNPYMDYITPSITRVMQPIKQIGQAAMKILYESICNDRKPNSQILMSSTIVKRKSVARKEE